MAILIPYAISTTFKHLVVDSINVKKLSGLNKSLTATRPTSLN